MKCSSKFSPTVQYALGGLWEWCFPPASMRHHVLNTHYLCWFTVLSCTKAKHHMHHSVLITLLAGLNESAQNINVTINIFIAPHWRGISVNILEATNLVLLNQMICFSVFDPVKTDFPTFILCASLFCVADDEKLDDRAKLSVAAKRSLFRVSCSSFLSALWPSGYFKLHSGFKCRTRRHVLLIKDTNISSVWCCVLTVSMYRIDWDTVVHK